MGNYSDVLITKWSLKTQHIFLLYFFKTIANKSKCRQKYLGWKIKIENLSYQIKCKCDMTKNPSGLLLQQQQQKKITKNRKWIKIILKGPSSLIR